MNRKICLYKIEDDSVSLIAEGSLKQEMLESDVSNPKELVHVIFVIYTSF